MIRAALLCVFVAACGASGPPPESPPAPPLPTEPIAGPPPATPPPAQEAFEGKPVPVAAIPASAPCVVPTALRVIGSGTRDSFVDAVSLDGASLSARVVSGKTVTVAVYATASYGVLSIAPLDPRALAWSFDGKRQVIVDGATVVLHSDGGPTETVAGAAAPASPPSPSVAGPGEASMSHDGRFLVLEGAPVVYDLVQKTRAELPPPPIAGGSDVVYRIDATGHFLFAENSRVAFVGALARAGGKVTVTWEATSQGAQRTPDGSLWLEVPRTPFAQDWIPSFALGSPGAGSRGKVQLPLRIGPKEPYAAALCPGGNLVAVLTQGSLGLYAADTGKLVVKKSAKELGLPMAATSLLFVDGGRSLLVRAPPKEVAVALGPR